MKAAGGRKRPDVSDNKPVADVLNAAGLVVLTTMTGILAQAAGAVSLVLLIVNHVRPIVRSRQAEPLGQAMFEMHLQRMIRAVAIGGQQPDAPESLIGPPRLDVTGAGIGTVEVQLAGVEKCPLVSEVAHIQSIVPAQLPRHLQVPVLNVRIDVSPVRRDGNHVEHRLLRIERQRNRILNGGHGNRRVDHRQTSRYRRI